jgi:hypothetical protein
LLKDRGYRENDSSAILQNDPSSIYHLAGPKRHKKAADEGDGISVFVNGDDVDRFRTSPIGRKISGKKGLIPIDPFPDPSCIVL